MDFAGFVKLFMENGVEGLVIGLVVLVSVYVVSFTGLLPDGNWKRALVLVFSTLFAGVDLLNPQTADALVGVIATVVSSGLYLLIQALTAYVKARSAKK